MIINLYFSWKTGSTFARKYFKDVCKISGINYVHVVTNDKPKIKYNNNYCMCLYRVPNENNFNNKNKNEYNIIQLRDPRDVIVSAYYSMAYTHPYGSKTEKIHESIQKQGIDSFAINKYAVTLKVFENTINVSKKMNNINFINYSTMVLNFEQWVKQTTEHFNITSQQKNKLFETYKHEFENINEITETELKLINPTAKFDIKYHKRKMIPGDYKQKLKPATVKILNDKFSNVLEFMSKIN